jgi:hypothetical protein
MRGADTKPGTGTGVEQAGPVSEQNGRGVDVQIAKRHSNIEKNYGLLCVSTISPKIKVLRPDANADRRTLGSTLALIHATCSLDHDVAGGEGTAFFAFLHAANAVLPPHPPPRYFAEPA